jgi:nucleoside-diphosphate-sugar epimerase
MERPQRELLSNWGKGENKRMNLNIYSGKTVLITGHTGFKGSWLAIWLKELGAWLFTRSTQQAQ